MSETEFSPVRFDGNQEKAKAVYHSTDPLSAEDIAETVFWICSMPCETLIKLSLCLLPKLGHHFQFTIKDNIFVLPKIFLNSYNSAFCEAIFQIRI